MVMAPFDGGLFRAKVTRKHNKDNLYDVQFIDYGNKDTFAISDLWKIPASVSYYEPQAVKCSLAYVECPPKWSDLFNGALDICYKMCWDKKIIAHVVYTDGNFKYVVLSPAGKADIHDSLNYTLLESAMARVSPYTPPKRDLLDEMNKVELTATDKNPAILSVFNREEEY